MPVNSHSFIGIYDLPDQQICASLIQHFESCNQVTPGGFMIDQCYVVDTKRKACDQTMLSFDQPLWHQYQQQLQHVTNQYIAQYPWCDRYDPWRVCEPVQIQRYRPQQAYWDYHTERTGCRGAQSARHLVFMTYLNTVTHGGGTEFPQQHTVTDAVCGRTVLWPADWTHTHKGLTSPDQTKYIITGWFSFV